MRSTPRAAGSRLTPGELSRGLLALPGIGIAAIGADCLFRPLPAALAAPGHRVIESRSALDIVLPSDRRQLIDAWQALRRSGYAVANPHLLSAPDERVAMHFVDLTDLHGVYLMIVVPEDAARRSVPAEPVGRSIPRLARLRKNEGAILTDIDAATTLMLGWTREDLIGRRSLELIHPDDRALAIDSWMQMLRSRGLEHRVRLRHACKDGAWKWVEISNVNRLDDATDPGVATELLDVSHEMAVVEPLIPRLARMRKNEVAIVADIDVATTLMLGWTREDLIGRHSLSLIHPDDRALAIDSWMQMLGGLEHRVRLRHACKDGAWKWVEISHVNRSVDATDPGVATELLDVSHEMAVVEALRAREELLQKLAEALPNGVLQFDRSGRITYVNRRLAEVMGELGASTIDQQFAVVDEDDRRSVKEGIEAVLAGRDVDLEVRLEDDPVRGAARRCSLRMRPLADREGAVMGAVASVTDTTESARMRAELERRASTDPLTGCSNRAAVVQHLTHALATEGAAVVYIDLDKFKPINDQLGHGAGDELLKTIAERLKGAARRSDCVGRVGGDEFMVVCPGIESDDDARLVAERIVEAVCIPVHLGIRVVEASCSVGVAVASRGSALTANELIAQADAAMYTSKRGGGGHAVLATLPH